jgi:glycosyltransferase involved in cell wall biosynthesis
VKVVARVHGYPPQLNAGAEMMLHALLRALAARGHDCEVYLTDPCTARLPYRWQGIYVVPKGAFDSEKAVKTADVVISHLGPSSHTQLMARRFGTPMVYLVHNDFQVSTQRELSQFPADLTVFNSQSMADNLAEYGTGIVVPPPVDPEEYRVEPGDHVTLINLMAHKGSRLFYRLAGRMPDIPFLAVEGGYGAQVIRRGLANVTFMGHTPDIKRAYERTKILLMPSVYESWGRVGVEAMSSGIPVIAHPTPGLQESLGSAGIFVDLNDVDGWIETVRTLMNDPEAYAAASAAARQRAIDLDPAESLARFCSAVEALA